MNNYFNKYSKQYSYIFLSAYLFLISLTIFHYHQYDFTQGNYWLEQSHENQTPNPFDKFTDVNGECAVVHFSNSVVNIYYVPIFNTKIESSEFYLSIRNNKVPKQEFNYEHHLRVPPSKIS